MNSRIRSLIAVALLSVGVANVLPVGAGATVSPTASNGVAVAFPGGGPVAIAYPGGGPVTAIAYPGGGPVKA